MPTDSSRLVLVGGGLGGALLAASLGSLGYQIDLYERRPDPGAGQYAAGRSINLAISTRGLDALARVGLADAVLSHAIPMRGRMIHTPRGELHFQPYDIDPARCIHSIGRGVLNALTIDAARKMPNVRVHFDQRCTDVELDQPAALLRHEPTGETTRAVGKAIIGIDGAFSAVRRAMMQRLDRFDYSQHTLGHGYKELTIPPAADGLHAMEKNALHIWPRRSFMLIALPNVDGSFTCTLFLSMTGPVSLEALRGDDAVLRFFETHFPDALPMMPTLLRDFRENPTGSMVTVRCAPWCVGGKVALVGDAAHAVVPFYGQGANCAFEDCVALAACLREHGASMDAAFAEYERRRRANANALADLALLNFIEMRDKTASRAFHVKKRVERALHSALPGVYTPLYTMVSFSLIPYAETIRRAARQDRVVRGAAAVLLVMIGWVAGWIAGEALVGALLAALAAALLMQLAAYRRELDRRDARRSGARLE